MNTKPTLARPSSFVLSFIFLSFLLTQSACMNDYKVIDDMNDASFELVNQDSVRVTFPEDFRGHMWLWDLCTLIAQIFVL